MQTLTPTTTIRWINVITQAHGAIVGAMDHGSANIVIWSALLDARIALAGMRAGLLELTVAPVEVESAQ